METTELDNKIDATTNCCEPIRTLAEAWNYLENIPDWTNSIIRLISRGPFVIKNTKGDCHVEEKKFVPKERLDAKFVPKTLVCHDMMNGYLEDRFIEPPNIGRKYAFYRWSQIDIFVYFSHHLITIPPLCWINTAHKNGVKILGTFITEWSEGEKICDEILESTSSMQRFAKILVDISIIFRFEGWLLNIENKVKNPERLQQFVHYLTEQMHLKKPESLIIWYDSVVCDGSLDWQNELNEKNRCYFDSCDGIFINYTWNEKNLENTKLAAEHRYLDVYVGVDVFGRNFYGGGKFNTYKAVEKIRQNNFSVAIFAQAWTHETLHKEPSSTFLERFIDRDNAFWKSLWPFLYTHPYAGYFSTFFYLGIDENWFKLYDQDFHLSQFVHPTHATDETNETETLKDECNCLQLRNFGARNYLLITKHPLQNVTPLVHRLFYCDIVVTGPLLVYLCTKKLMLLEPNFSVVMLVLRANGAKKKVVCEMGGVEGKTRRDFSEERFVASHRRDVLELLRDDLGEIPSDWKVTAYPVTIGYGRIVEIGVKLDNTSGYLCAFGIKSLNL